MLHHMTHGQVFLEDTDLFGPTPVAVDLDVPADRLPHRPSGPGPHWAGCFTLPRGKDIVLGGPYTLRLDDGSAGEIDVVARSAGCVAHFQGVGPLSGLGLATLAAGTVQGPSSS